MKVVASAPGKVVLSGEYAVLDGAPAVCAAVNRRAVVKLDKSPDGQCHISSPGISGEDRFSIVDAVCGGARPSLSIQLDTRLFSEEGHKIGIGSSAALTVALVAALGKSNDVFVKALLAHSELQGGAGSGVDVAAAAHGGLIAYEMKTRSVSQIGWPDGLAWRLLWTGSSASTAAKLAKLAEHAGGPSRSALGLAAKSMAEAWRTGDVDEILMEYVSYIRVLRQFSVDHDLGIFDAGHEQLTDAAMLEQLVYKPAGAGGGDIGILFGRRESDLDRFIAKNSELVHTVLPCELDPNGVRLEQQ
jgi:phosphomevalonate kinase